MVDRKIVIEPSSFQFSECGLDDNQIQLLTSSKHFNTIRIDTWDDAVDLTFE